MTQMCYHEASLKREDLEDFEAKDLSSRGYTNKNVESDFKYKLHKETHRLHVRSCILLVVYSVAFEDESLFVEFFTPVHLTVVECDEGLSP